MIFRRQWLEELLSDLNGVSDQAMAETLSRLGIPTAAEMDPKGIHFRSEIPENRKDLMCILGIARELGGALGISLRPLDFQTAQEVSSIFESLDMDVPAESVLRYSVRLVKACRIAPSPQWLQDRLLDLGITSVCNFRDIASWVQAVTGQTLLTADLRSLPGNCYSVRDSFEGELVSLSDGQSVSLPAGVPVVSDENWEPISLSGMQSPLSPDCEWILICCPSYDPSVEEKLKKILPSQDLKNLKPSDPMGTIDALNLFSLMVESMNLGCVLEGTLDNLNYVPQPRILPAAIPKSVLDNFSILGFSPEENGTIIPSFRKDIDSLQDLMNEFLRIETSLF